jgi:chemotaxis protein MotB
MSQTWVKRRGQANQTDDWLMTYADMITLLLCLFAIFLAVSLRQKAAQVNSLSTAKRLELPHNRTTESDERVLAVRAAKAEKAYTALLEVVNRLKSQGSSSIEQGDRIIMLQINSEAFFASGSATLSDSGRAILKDVAANIDSDQYRDYQITVEGHTDDSPISTRQFPSNWELSTARAAAVVHFFLQQGIPAQRLRAAGYADTFPVAPDRDPSGRPLAENRARNRRVVIKLEKIEKSENEAPNSLANQPGVD